MLLPAYDDAAGVTAAFNRNLLIRLNREAGADFDLGASPIAPSGTTPRAASRCTWSAGATRPCGSPATPFISPAARPSTPRTATNTRRSDFADVADAPAGTAVELWTDPRAAVLTCTCWSRAAVRDADHAALLWACSPVRNARSCSAGAMHAAFQRADGAAGHFGGDFIGFFLQHDHEQRFALVRRQAIRAPSPVHATRCDLRARRYRHLRHGVHVGEFAAAAHAADEVIDHDPMHPGGEIGARDKAVPSHQRLGRNILRQILGGRSVPRQCQRPDAHLWQECGKFFVKLVRQFQSPNA